MKLTHLIDNYFDIKRENVAKTRWKCYRRGYLWKCVEKTFSNQCVWKCTI